MTEQVLGTGGVVTTGGSPPVAGQQVTGGVPVVTAGTVSTGGVSDVISPTGGVLTGGSTISGGAAVTGGVAMTGGSAATGGSEITNPDAPPCIDDPNQVVIIGDSYINWGSHTLPADLVRESGQTWPMYAVGGASMATGGIATLVPDQFEQAYAANKNIKAVVMDGGGNDVLISAATWGDGGQCKNSRDSASLKVCQDIVDASVDAAAKLFSRMAEVGVEDVLFFFYPYVPEGTPIGGAAPNAILDYSLPLVRENCQGLEAKSNGKIRCHWVDMIPVFDGQTGVFAAADIHPNAKGSGLMAKAIWQTMSDGCMAQPSSSGCCRTQ